MAKKTLEKHFKQEKNEAGMPIRIDIPAYMSESGLLI